MFPPEGREGEEGNLEVSGCDGHGRQYVRHRFERQVVDRSKQEYKKGA